MSSGAKSNVLFELVVGGARFIMSSLITRASGPVEVVAGRVVMALLRSVGSVAFTEKLLSGGSCMIVTRSLLEK